MSEPAGSLASPDSTGIAIIGIACCLPGIEDLSTYTESLFAGTVPSPQSTGNFYSLPSHASTAENVLHEAFVDAKVDQEDRGKAKIGIIPDPSPEYSYPGAGELLVTKDSISGYLQSIQRLVSGDFDLIVWAGAYGGGFLSVILKRLVDAVAEGDRIYAVIRPDLSNPRHEAALSEPTDESFGKTLISVINNSLALHHRIFPPSCAAGATARPWIHPGMQDWVRQETTTMDTECSKLSEHRLAAPRRAAVLGSADVALVLEEHGDSHHRQASSPVTKWNSELFIFEADSYRLLLKPVQKLLGFLSRTGRESSLNLKDLACTVNTTEWIQPDSSDKKMSCRLAIVAGSVSDLEEKLLLAARKLLAGEQESIRYNSSRHAGVYYADKNLRIEGDLAFLLPGLGAAYPDMLSDLCLHYPEVREVFDFVDQLALDIGETSLPSSQIFSTAENKPAGSINLAQSSSAVVNVLMGEYALFLLLEKLGIEPDTVLGCSTGEFAALAINGSVNILNVARFFYKLSSQVARAIPEDQAKELRSLRIVAPFSTIERHLDNLSSRVYLSAELGPAETVISGAKAAVGELTALLKTNSIEFQQLPLAIPYHTPLVDNALQIDPDELARIPITAPSLKSWSCSTATTYPDQPESIRRLTTELFKRPVRLARAVETMHAEGVAIFVELGPKGTLTSFVKQILKSKPHVAIASNLPNRPAITQINHLLAVLFCQGRSMDLTYLYSRRRPQHIDVEYESPEQIPQKPAGHSEVPEVCGDERQNVMSAYLNSVTGFQKKLMQVQQTVMTAYLESEEETGFDAALSDTKFRLPFLAGAEIVFAAGDSGSSSVEARKVLSLREDLYLLDHAIGGNTRAGACSPDRVYLVPLMVSIEMMAEVAALATCSHFEAPVPVSIENVRAFKRIRVDQTGNTIRVIARLSGPAPNKVFVEIRSDGPDPEVLASCDVCFAENYPPAPDFVELDLDHARPPAISADRLYSKDTMFHGPLMQSVKQLTAVGKNGLTGQINVRRCEGWFASDPQLRHPESVLTDPLLIDNSSQLVLYYLFEHNLPVAALLPFHIESMEFFGPPHMLPELVNAQATLLAAGDERTRARIEISDGRGRLHARITGIVSRRITPPGDWAEFVTDPVSRFVSNRIDCVSGSRYPNLICTRLDKNSLPPDRALSEWLGDYILTKKEQAYLAGALKQPGRKAEWLTGRMAIKDAVRILLKQSKNLTVAPADIEIVSSENGDLSIKGDCFKADGEIPRISLSHKDGIAVAAAAFTAAPTGVGIDLETKRSFDDHFEALALTEPERTILDELGASSKSDPDRNEAICRIWCAKESIAKAAGRGLGNNPKNIEVIAADWNSGQLQGRFASEEQSFLVHTSSQDGMVIGFTALETAVQPAV